MNDDGIEYHEGRATREDIEAHLERCDRDFSPDLSLKVDIGEYSTKLKARARTFEAWSRKALVGLVAAYMNDAGTRIGYISSVSVVREFTGRGIALALLELCRESARREGMEALRLKVSQESARAIRLYEKFGFSEIEREGKSVVMELKFHDGRRS